ncbi:MAG: hypothetical protein ACMUIM_02750 [bacterium]
MIGDTIIEGMDAPATGVNGFITAGELIKAVTPGDIPIPRPGVIPIPIDGVVDNAATTGSTTSAMEAPGRPNNIPWLEIPGTGLSMGPWGADWVFWVNMQQIRRRIIPATIHFFPPDKVPPFVVSML